MVRYLELNMKLIFVYNADGGMLATLKDAIHKTVSPSTYGCNLCRITYPGASMREEWQAFIQSLPYEVVFSHRDEFREKYPDAKNVQLPAVFTTHSDRPELLISHIEINKAKKIENLIETVQRFLKKFNNISL